ncbi:hypothetical protein GALL_475370 [mine drainage metagenome]|uniref:Uncharacterized protein n=1 Tax=mine drainage metagenome TaxID=410659 RepID=A0A1J5PSZ0_9ZZZZ
MDVVKRGADHAGLIVQQLAAFDPLGPDDFCHVGLQDHRAAIGRAMFRHLHPAVLHHAHVEDDMAFMVAAFAADRPVVGAVAVGQFKVARAADAVDVVVEGQAGVQRLAQVQHVGAKARVAHDKHVRGIEQREALLHRLDRIGEVLARGLGIAVGLFQPRVRQVEQIQRAFQIAGAFAHLLLQHRGALELGVGGARGIGGLLYPFHQNRGDLHQLFVLPLQRIRWVDKGIGHGVVPGA